MEDGDNNWRSDIEDTEDRDWPSFVYPSRPPFLTEISQVRAELDPVRSVCGLKATPFQYCKDSELTRGDTQPLSDKVSDGFWWVVDWPQKGRLKGAMGGDNLLEIPTPRVWEFGLQVSVWTDTIWSPDQYIMEGRSLTHFLSLEFREPVQLSYQPRQTSWEEFYIPVRATECWR